MLNESSTPNPLAAGARLFAVPLALALSAAGVAAPSAAVARDKPAAAKPKPAQETAAPDAAADKKSRKGARDDKSGASAKPEQLGVYGEWGAYLAQSGKDKTCYALGQPKERQPKAKLKDVAAYVFISTRPAEGVRNEVAINLGYATKDGSAATADIDGAGWELVTKGTNAWVKDQSREKEFVGALRGGAKLVVKAASAKGTATTDLYLLKGVSDALARVAQECK